MKIIYLVLVLVILVSFESLCSLEPLSDENGPLYERVPLIKDYRLNQPIEYAVRWGSIGFLYGLWGGYNYNQKKELNIVDSFDESSEYSWEICKVAALSGAIVGLYNGVLYEKERERNPEFHLAKERFGYDLSLDFSLSGREGISFECNLALDILFFNELQLGLSDITWVNTNFFDIDEIKYYIQGTKFSLLHRFFNPYYGFGLGLTRGEIRQSYGYFEDESFLVEGLYPFLQAFSGFRLSIIDLFYLRFDINLELSSFIAKANKYQNDAYSNCFFLGISIGTKIF